MKSRLMRELRRALANKQYETDPNQGLVHFPRSNLDLRGVFDMAVNDGPREFFPNLIVNEFRTDALEQLFGSTAKRGTYYIAPFAGNVTPVSTWDASNFTSNSTEFTNYDEATREEWTVGSVSSFSIGNSASRAQFTIGAGGQTTIWGAGLLSESAKSSTAGVLVAASKAASARDNLVDGDIVTIGYTITLNDGS